MADISLDLNPASPTYKDWLFVNNDIVLTNDTVTGAEFGSNPVLQDCIQRLSMFLGEWFLDNTQGTPWLQQILVKNPDLGAIDAIFKNIILGTPGVQQLAKFNLNLDSARRILSVSFSIVTSTGTVNYNGILAPVYAGARQQTILSP